MYAIPLKKNDEDWYDVILVLTDDTLERIKTHDPAEFDTRKVLDKYRAHQLRQIVLCYESETDMVQLFKLLKDGRIVDALKFLHRGFKVLPGDHDGPYHDMLHGSKPS